MGFLLNQGSAKLPDGVRLFDYMPGARFSKVPIINGPGKLSPFTFTIEVSIHDNYQLVKQNGVVC